MGQKFEAGSNYEHITLRKCSNTRGYGLDKRLELTSGLNVK